MKLQTLAGLERKKIEDELKEKMALIAELEAILKSDKRVLAIVKDELLRVKEKFGDERKTKIIKSAIGEFKQEDLIPNEEAIITITEQGYIKRMDPSVYKVQKRGGKGVIGAVTKEEDTIKKVIGVMSHDNLLFFTNSGKCFKLRPMKFPLLLALPKVNLLLTSCNFLKKNQLQLSFHSQDDGYKFLFMTTEMGTVKKPT